MFSLSHMLEKCSTPEIYLPAQLLFFNEIYVIVDQNHAEQNLK